MEQSQSYASGLYLNVKVGEDDNDRIRRPSVCYLGRRLTEWDYSGKWDGPHAYYG